MKNLEPIDDGVRRFRPGTMLILCVLTLLAGGGFIFWKVRSQQVQAAEAENTETVVEIIKEIKKPSIPEPSIHPLEGLRRVFLADGCRYRFQELTFVRDFSEQHDFPGAVVRENDPCLWRFEGVPEEEDVYRIYCADPNFPNLHDRNLTYTRLLDDGVPVDEEPPYLTLRADDPCEWRVRKLAHRDQFEVFCESGIGRFAKIPLGWVEEQDELKGEWVTATLGENGVPSWFILPAGQEPELPRRASHLIVMPRGELEDLEKAREHFAENGHEIFRVILETSDDEFERPATKLSYRQLVQSIRHSDPVIRHEDFPPLLGMTAGSLVESLGKGELPGDEDSLFPLIVPLKVALYPHLIHSLSFENTEFWANTWEELEDFQSRLDESDLADGRVYRGELFTYIFVSWDR